jgi:hypothetical protein
MKVKKTNVIDLLQLIPEHFFDKIAEETNVDFQVKKLNGKLMFNLLLMGILQSERLSLRVMEELFSTQKFQSFSGLKADSSTRHSSIRDRISTIPSSYFEELFYKIAELLNCKYKQKDIGKYKIERFDSTVVSLSSKLLNFGMISGKKPKEGEYRIHQLKFTIGFNGLLPHKVKVYSEQKYLAENDSLYETIMENEFEKNNVAVFDRGLNSRTKFSKIDRANKLFVTRINPTKNYKIINVISEQIKSTKTLLVEKDLLVNLRNHDGEYVKTALRLIIAKNKENNEYIYFISNIEEITSEEITEIYKMRWDIEVFFRFLKQELNLNHLVSRNHNGILVMLYMTLITAMLLLVYKHLNNVSGYKIAKLKFTNELDQELLKEIIIACNGDPNMLKNKESP